LFKKLNLNNSMLLLRFSQSLNLYCYENVKIRLLCVVGMVTFRFVSTPSKLTLNCTQTCLPSGELSVLSLWVFFEIIGGKINAIRPTPTDTATYSQLTFGPLNIITHTPSMHTRTEPPALQSFEKVFG